MRSASLISNKTVIRLFRRQLAYIALLMLATACVIHTRAVLGAEENALDIQGKWPDKFHDTLRYRRVSATQYPSGRRTAREYLATINVAVLTHRGEAAILSWKYTNLSLNGEPMADLALELSVTADGVVELLNIDDLQRKVLREAQTKPKSGTPMEFGGDELAKMAANKEALGNFYLRDAEVFFYPQGTTVRRDRPVKFDNEIRGFGGDTMKAVDRWTVLAQRDAPASTIAIEWTQDVDRGDVERFFSALGKALGMKIDANQGSLTKKGLYALDRRTFWPHVALVSTKTSVQKNYEQFDSVEMRSSLLDPNWKH